MKNRHSCNLQINRHFGLIKKEPRMRGSLVAGVEASVSAPGANGGRRCSDHLARTFFANPSFRLAASTCHQSVARPTVRNI